MKDIAHMNTDKTIERLENEINAVYSQVKKELEEELEAGLNWNKILSMKDKRKRLAAARKKRALKILINKMSKIIKNKNKIALNLINDRMTDVFINNYNWGAYFTENLTGFDLDFTLYNREAVTELLKETTPAFTKAAYLGAKDLATIQSDLRRGLTVSILKGGATKDMARRIDKVTDKNNHGSIRIARTEANRIENSGRLKAFKHGENKGLKLKKEWISTIDKRTRDSHRELQGETVGLDETFSNGLKYPGDPNGPAEETINCRCTMVTEFVGIKKGAAELKLDKKLKNMNYEEWHNKKAKVKPVKVAPAKNIIAKKSIAKKPAIKKAKTIKKYTRAELNKKSVNTLRKLARENAIKYYKSGAINLGGRKVEDVVNSLMAQKRSKTSLVKDIAAMQRRI